MHVAVTTDFQGVPVAQIPPQHLWELVEYLSGQRLSVHYSYHGEGFEVRFPRMTVAEARRTLDAWAHADVQLAA
jgi:hypothetical protein